MRLPRRAPWLALLFLPISCSTSCRRSPPGPQSPPSAPARRPEGQRSADNRPASLRLLTYNVLADQRDAHARIPALMTLLSESGADIIALQEVAPWFLRRLFAQRWVERYHPTRFGGRPGAPGGQMVLSRRPIKRAFFRLLPGRQRRTVVVAVVQISPGFELAVATTHMESFLEDGPTRARQLDVIFREVAGFKNSVVLGDFNFGDGEQPETRHLAPRFTDIWSRLRPEDAGYTWNMEASEMARRGSFVGEKSRRLDRILVRVAGYRPASVQIIGDRPIKAGGNLFPSDHFGLVGTISRSPP